MCSNDAVNPCLMRTRFTRAHTSDMLPVNACRRSGQAADTNKGTHEQICSSMPSYNSKRILLVSSAGYRCMVPACVSALAAYHEMTEGQMANRQHQDVRNPQLVPRPSWLHKPTWSSSKHLLHNSPFKALALETRLITNETSETGTLLSQLPGSLDFRTACLSRV